MAKKIIVFGVSIIVLIVAIFVLRKKDLTIHVMAETSNLTSSIHLKIDNEILFEGEVNSGVYFGEKIVVENMSIGFHSLKVEAVDDNVIYQKDIFFLFNKTIIITYFDKSYLEEKPYFDVWSKFGEFIPD